MRLCAIDVGTNTVNSLVADVADGRLAVVADEERFARLGQGVDASGRLAPEAMDRAVGCLAAAQATAVRMGAERVVIGATSASRDAENVDVLRARVRRELGLDYAVVSGEREAALSFRGALAMLPTAADGGLDAAVVVDVGGGSTEVAVGSRAGGVAFRRSVDVGSVRFSERFLRPAPPPAEAAARAEAAVRHALATVPAEVVAGCPVVATGSVARLLARLAGVDGPAPFVPAGTVAEWRARLLALTPEATLALAPDRLAGREDVVAASVLIVDTLLSAFGATGYVATPGGLRHGLALAAGNGEQGVGGSEGQGDHR